MSNTMPLMLNKANHPSYMYKFSAIQMTPGSGQFSMRTRALLEPRPLLATTQRLLKQKYHNAVMNITTRSVTNTPRKKPPVPDTLGSLTVGQSDAAGWQRDNSVFPHAWHHEEMSRTPREFTSLRNWSREHGSLHSGMLYFVNGSW